MIVACEVCFDCGFAYYRLFGLCLFVCCIVVCWLLVDCWFRLIVLLILLIVLIYLFLMWLVGL